MIRGDVRFHRDGDKFAISTNTETERDFLDGAAAGLTELLDQHSTDAETARDLGRWLPLIVDISAKMRGYKADVVEKRLIFAGAWLPSDTANVVAGGHVTADAAIGSNALGRLDTAPETVGA